MTQALIPAPPADAAVYEKVVAEGDLAKLTPGDRVKYYGAVCASLGLNPLTKPFDYLNLNSKVVLYATKSATDQLRAIHGVSILRLERAWQGDLFMVTATAVDKTGREDSSTGAIYIKGMVGDALANAIMKTETKAKRRVTLSLCGLGWLDESEVGSIAEARAVNVDMETGEVLEDEPDEPYVPTQLREVDDAPRSTRQERLLREYRALLNTAVRAKVVPHEADWALEDGVPESTIVERGIRLRKLVNQHAVERAKAT